MKKLIRNKKQLASIICILGFSVFNMNAQTISKNAIGVRVGDNNGFGSEISYQRALGSNNRLELGLGWRDNKNYDALKVSGIYQWVYALENRFNWYVGAGGGLGYFENNFNNDDETFVVLNGDLGIEYNFKIPLLISLDIRPEIGFNNNYSDGLDLDTALSFRYQF